MKSNLILAITVALVLPLAAEDPKTPEQTPAKPKPDPAKVFKKKDTNADGFLSKEEFTAGAKDAAKAETIFAKKDKDGDGKLSPEEFAGKGSKDGKPGKNGKDGKPGDKQPAGGQ
jgi:hypothetical protein